MRGKSWSIVLAALVLLGGCSATQTAPPEELAASPREEPDGPAIALSGTGRVCVLADPELGLVLQEQLTATTGVSATVTAHAVGEDERVVAGGSYLLDASAETSQVTVVDAGATPEGTLLAEPLALAAGESAVVGVLVPDIDLGNQAAELRLQVDYETEDGASGTIDGERLVVVAAECGL